MKKWLKVCLAFLLFILIAYGAGRLYYRVTGGFTLSNITYDLPFDPRWETKSPPSSELHALLNQPFHYLGKGCQSYVFESADGKYVLKFFKYQRFRPQSWLKLIPGLENYRKEKAEKKRKKLEGVFTSWKIAYESLQNETGVVFVHLNKSSEEMPLQIFDKMGRPHALNLARYEFMLQHKAKLLCPTLNELMEQGRVADAKQLLDNLLQVIQSEYSRGFADNDHALMQNTGVLNGKPIHIDAGQFVKNQKVKNLTVANQELFNKTWKFRKWLEEKHPELATYLEIRLRALIGSETFNQLKPRLTKGGVGALSHEQEP